MKIKEIIQRYKDKLNENEIFQVLEYCTKMSKVDLICNLDRKIEDLIIESIDSIAKKKINGMPLSKALGFKSFWKSEFITNEHVLDPRQDSEIIIEAVLEHVDRNKEYKILDLGTGSGCLIISLLQEMPNSTGIGIDISDQAIKVAQENAKKMKIDDRVKFKKSDWFSNIDLEDKLFNIIISNPPYIERNEIFNLSKEVKDHDPIISLDGGYNGLDSYKKIIPLSYRILEKEGILALEHGYNQQNKVKDLCLEFFKNKYYKYKDLNKNNRVLLFIK